MYKLLAGLLAVAFILTGCNTMEGAGKDIERGGEKIQDKAEKAKNWSTCSRRLIVWAGDTCCVSRTGRSGGACRYPSV